MQKPEQYRQFADTLTAAALQAQDAAHDMLLSAAAAWRSLADAADPQAATQGAVIDFADAKRRMQLESA
ncbi:hypothetical protein [Phenylobacterium sp.]|uniref:hypothetical protein n=1 Tax=Phenylobacterium sp. TaxID=1871053 RepID=UPI002F401D3E